MADEPERSPTEPAPTGRPRVERAGRFLQRRSSETVLGGLIILSAALTVVETTTPIPDPRVVVTVHAISALFVVELVLRWRSAVRARTFFREYFLDIFSLAPLFVALLRLVSSPASFTVEQPAWLSALALLRIFRLTRLLKIARHLVLIFPRVLRRGARELFFASGFVLLAIVFASSALVTFERDQNPNLASFTKAFWFSVYSVVAAEPIPSPPMTFGGHVVAVFVILTGLFSFATVVGTISALVTDRMRGGELIVEWEDLHDHLIVCGWSSRAEIIVSEYVKARVADEPVVVVIAEHDHGVPQLTNPAVSSRVQFLVDDFTRIEALEKAGVRRAARCILLSDTSRGRKERDADARTILAALTIERLNPAIYTVAEINRREHGHHLEMGKVNDYVVSGEHSAFLLAQSAITRGVMSVFSELLTHAHGNRFSRCSLPKKFAGKTFLEMLATMKTDHNAILVAVQRGDKTIINPTSYTFEGGEDLVCIAQHDLRL